MFGNVLRMNLNICRLFAEDVDSVDPATMHCILVLFHFSGQGQPYFCAGRPLQDQCPERPKNGPIDEIS